MPTYINYNHWGRDFRKLYDILGHSSYDNIMIIGDLNARIGKEEGRENRLAGKVRNSKDSTTNSRGSKLLELCDSFGFHIMNGVSGGDKFGELTYVGQQGCSVIDYCLIRGEWISIVTKLEILCKQYSDHLPILAEFAISPLADVETISILPPPKLKWKHSNATEYRSNLDRNLNNEQLNMSEIENVVKKSYPKNRQSFKKLLMYKEKWFDKECEIARQKSFGWLKVFRIYGNSLFKDLYNKTNMTFKRLCKVKKKQFYEKEALSLTCCRNTK